MTNIFEGAKFGDKFVDKAGKTYIYHYVSDYKSSEGKIWKYHYLMREPEIITDEVLGDFTVALYKPYVNINGIGVPANLKYSGNLNGTPNEKYVIVSRYQEKIDENKLDELANEYKDSFGWNHGFNPIDDFKVGYRKAKNE